MTITLPKLRIGDPLCHEALSVFPLFTDTNGGIVDQLTLARAALYRQLLGTTGQAHGGGSWAVTTRTVVRTWTKPGRSPSGAGCSCSKPLST
jgi:hypothetical protein